MKKVLSILFGIITMATAQESDTLQNWQWEGLHAIKLNIKGSGTSNIDSLEGELQHHQIDLYCQLPIHMGDKNYFGAGVIYRGTMPNLSGTDIAIDPSVGNMGQLIFAYNRMFSPKWSLYAEYNGGISGVWKEPQYAHSHMTFTYGAYKHSSRSLFRIGGGFAYAFDGWTILPILGANVGFNDHLALDILLPTHASLRYRITNRFELGSRLNYHAGSMGFSDSILESPISYGWSHFTGCGYTDFRLHKNIILRVEGGVEFGKSITVKDDKHKEIFTAETENTPYAAGSIRLQI